MSGEPEEKPDLRATLEAAFAESSAPSAEGAAAPEAAQAAPKTDAAPVRDDHGRFAPKGEQSAKPADTPAVQTPNAPAPEAQPEPIQPPASWSAPAKAKFATLDPEIQQEIIRREKDVSKGFEERASQLKRYEPLESVIAPHRDRIALAGIDEAAYVRSLISADEMLRGPNRIQALAQIAQSYGIDLRQFAQGAPAQQPQAQLPPQVQALQQEVARLNAAFTQQQTAEQQAKHAQTQAEIDTFAKDHLYFDNVRPEMAALLRSGQADTLAKAYEMACWARPDIRPLMLAEQEKAKQAQAAEAARAKANEAKQAGGSITGSPAPGAQASQRSGPPPSIRESLEAAFRGTA